MAKSSGNATKIPNLVAIVFYHPKDPRNVEDIALISRALNVEFIVIPRNYEDISIFTEKAVNVAKDLQQVSKLFNGRIMYLVLETYGSEDLTILSTLCSHDIVLVLGAEDYGIPRDALENLSPRVVLRIPMKIPYASFNVVTSLVVILYELFKQCSHSSSK